MNKTIIPITFLLMLAGCQSNPALEDDTRYTKLARVVEVHVYTDAERREAKLQRRDSSVGFGLSLGVGTYGSFGYGGLMFGSGNRLNSPSTVGPQVADGANRYAVEPLEKAERIEVLSYGKYQVGDCVKLMSGHPSAYARLFDLKPGERCDKPAK
jgi:hypothetical protein